MTGDIPPTVDDALARENSADVDDVATTVGYGVGCLAAVGLLPLLVLPVLGLGFGLGLLASLVAPELFPPIVLAAVAIWIAIPVIAMIKIARVSAPTLRALLRPWVERIPLPIRRLGRFLSDWWW